MTKQELPKTYDAKNVEDNWYNLWQKNGHFKPKAGKANQAYCIIMPPPNVTGMLHMGHALDATTQDILTRFKRMKGFETLWLPGMDHAGIATQSVVEKMLYEKEGKTRHEYDRDDFLNKIWQWKEEYGGIIAKQQRSLGASCDWDYSMFTMDPEANEAVNKAFVSLYNEGLIYQSDYIVNWDPKLQSAISDAEVEHKEIKGAFYHIHYKIKGHDEVLEVATTRPETLLGDTAVAVHPDDPRYNKFIGKTAIIPICNREVPIIGDDYVDMEKGTGCLKVTPGHDFNDFEIGKRHNLEIINILNKDGTLNDYGLEFRGQQCSIARKAIVEKLKELDQFVKEEKHVHQVGHGDRSKVVIEPMVSKQWFLNTKKMAEVAVKMVEDDETVFYPKSWENTYFAWLRDPKDWCISRQLWWGHRIPVYTCNACQNEWASETDASTCTKCKSSEITQDPDVLDTWFSSGLWPLTTLGWPDKKRMEQRKFDTFYPTSVLVTGFDIIFFWVARMMMMDIKMFGQKPFDKVYIHAIVRDKHGKKMSKSLGNGIDPLEVCKQYGADSLRFTLAAGSGYNRTLNLDPERIEGYRNFINKLWNAFRFIYPFLSDASDEVDNGLLNEHDKWIIHELNIVSKNMNHSIEEFRFDDACSSLYSFIYDKYCSWYIELSKPVLYGDDEKLKSHRAGVLKYTLRKIMALLHPVAPYISEEIWKYLKKDDEDMLIVQDYPEYDKAINFESECAQMLNVMELVTSIRNLRASVNLPPKELVGVHIFTEDEKYKSSLEGQIEAIKSLARCESIKFEQVSSDRPAKSLTGVTTLSEIYIPMEGKIDIEGQINKINRDVAKTAKEFEKVDKKLNNKNFMDRAPEEVKQEVNLKHQSLSAKLDALEKSLKALQ